MSENKTRATAVVSVTLEIPVDGTWGPDCAIAQIYKQAREEALDKLRAVLDMQDFLVNRSAPGVKRPRVRLAGEPTVKGFLVQEQP